LNLIIYTKTNSADSQLIGTEAVRFLVFWWYRPLGV